MPTNYPGGDQNNPGPYAPPSAGHVTPGYFSPATPPPSQDVPRPYVAPGQQPAPQVPQQAATPQPPAYAAHPQMQPTAQAPYAPAQQHGQYTGLVGAVKSYFKQYATFSGRSTRSEFWWMQLILWGLLLVVSIFGTGNNGGVAGFLGGLMMFVYVLFVLGTVVPTLALFVRRFHDANMSGGLLALALIPYAGALVVYILAALPSNPRGVRYEKFPPNRPQGSYPLR